MFLLEVLADAAIDTVKLLPFLFITYLIMEIIEHRIEERSVGKVSRSGRLGPLVGGALGVVPQCGFSASAASLYSGGLISAGTLLAIFLSTSDEMLPIFISEGAPVVTLLLILVSKFGIGVITGYVVDLFGWRFHKERMKKDVHDLCEQDNCHCERGVFYSAFKHTIQIALFIFILTFGIGLLIHLAGEEAIAVFISSFPVLGVFLTALVGLIPNCAASVVITELYLQGLIGIGQMMAGLLVGAGVGLLVLFRTNRHWKENARLTVILYIAGVLWGLLISALAALCGW